MKIEERSLYDKNLELIKKYREGDCSAGEELASLNRPLVYNIAGRFTGRGVDMDELVEMGTIGRWQNYPKQSKDSKQSLSKSQ